jgi:hypothetical protein
VPGARDNDGGGIYVERRICGAGGVIEKGGIKATRLCDFVK